MVLSTWSIFITEEEEKYDLTGWEKTGKLKGNSFQYSAIAPVEAYVEDDMLRTAVAGKGLPVHSYYDVVTSFDGKYTIGEVVDYYDSFWKRNVPCQVIGITVVREGPALKSTVDLVNLQRTERSYVFSAGVSADS